LRDVALHSLNMGLTKVLIVACPRRKAAVPVPSFIDLTEFWREGTIQRRLKTCTKTGTLFT
jgi:hypothetical protein